MVTVVILGLVVPVALVLLPPSGVTLYLFCALGVTLYEFTVGFYLSARGRFTVRDSLLKIVHQLRLRRPLQHVVSHGPDGAPGRLRAAH